MYGSQVHPEVTKLNGELVETRRTIHRQPELSLLGTTILALTHSLAINRSNPIICCVVLRCVQSSKQQNWLLIASGMALID